MKTSFLPLLLPQNTQILPNRLFDVETAPTSSNSAVFAILYIMLLESPSSCFPLMIAFESVSLPQILPSLTGLSSQSNDLNNSIRDSFDSIYLRASRARPRYQPAAFNLFTNSPSMHGYSTPKPKPPNLCQAALQNSKAPDIRRHVTSRYPALYLHNIIQPYQSCTKLPCGKLRTPALTARNLLQACASKFKTQVVGAREYSRMHAAVITI